MNFITLVHAWLKPRSRMKQPPKTSRPDKPPVGQGYKCRTNYQKMNAEDYDEYMAQGFAKFQKQLKKDRDALNQILKEC